MTETAVGLLWSVVLAGHEHPLDLGMARASVGAGERTTRLRRTIERASRLTPHRRVVVVSTRGSDEGGWATPELVDAQRVVQPTACGTAVETFLALLKIARQDPDAVVVVLPGQHHVEHEEAFLEHVAAAVTAVARRPDLVVVMGAPPLAADETWGWIEPGEPVEGLEDLAVRQVKRFVAERRAPGSDATALISTRVLVGNVRTLLAHGRRHVPDVLETLEPVEEVFGRPEEPLLCDAVYEAMPHTSLATLLERGEPLAILSVSAVARRDRAPADLPIAA